MFQHSPEGMFICDATWTIIQINPAFTETSGYSSAESVGLNFNLVFAASYYSQADYLEVQQALEIKGYWHADIMSQHKSGQIVPMQLSLYALTAQNTEAQFYIACFRPPANSTPTEIEWQQWVYQDSLTAVLNRRALESRLEQEISKANRSMRIGAVIFLDLDDFKKVNDSLGHKAGDQLLQQVSQRLAQQLRIEDMLARLGGDEFIIVLTDIALALEEAARATGVIIKKLLQLLREPYCIDGFNLYLSASFGVTFFPNFAHSVEDALKQADTAMYSSKRRGKNAYTFFYPEMQLTADHRLRFESELRQALHLKQLFLVYQPQYDREQHCIGHEALVRWRHPEKGILLPADFIPHAEETGLIIEIGEEVVRLACIQLALWQQQKLHNVTLSINISPHQFKHPGFVDHIQQTLETTGVDPFCIILEITESVLITNLDEVVAKMQRLKHLGIRFALDDFGTGFSTLAYLRSLPIDQIKIDRSYIRNSQSMPQEAQIIKAIINIAELLQLSLIAEGVENPQQLEYLLAQGCQGFQGYWFSKPVSGEDI